jgi:hypothetical protein
LREAALIYFAVPFRRVVIERAADTHGVIYLLKKAHGKKALGRKQHGFNDG